MSGMSGMSGMSMHVWNVCAHLRTSTYICVTWIWLNIFKKSFTCIIMFWILNFIMQNITRKI
ncbi:hypothetical protein [Methanosarcina barkeri]|uniref:hypothetical protein n=1 Tax=Methanosarcina barkeri TaxID=2208 RepID=UPI0012D41894|nr:hypothetical protein [Methanosarcina barkeri]